MLTRPDRAHALPIGIFTLDTGRLPEETHDADRPRARALSASPIDVYFPDRRALEAFVRDARRQRVLRQRRAAQALLRDPQDRAAAPRACRQGRLDHRPAPRRSR